jgi:hypothetical protein
MAITSNLLTAFADNVNGSSYATSSISPGSNRLVLASVYNEDSALPPEPTLSGNGLTWVSVRTQNDSFRRFTVYRAMGASPSAGAVTIDMGGNLGVGCAWSIVEFDGVYTGGSNGSDAVVQSNGVSEVDADQSLSVTLAAFDNALNRPFFAASSNRNDTNTWTPKSGFTQLHNINMGSPLAGVFTQWRSDAADASPSTTLFVNGLVLHAIALEIRDAAAPPTAAGSPWHYYTQMRRK